MSFSQARDYVSEQVEDTLERVDSLLRKQKQPAQASNAVPGPAFQAHARVFVDTAEARLWDQSGATALAYLQSRGLEEKIIRAAHLGSVERAGTEYLVIPWYDVEQAAYWRVQIRNLTPNIPHDKRYTHLRGGSNSGLYLSEMLKRKLPTFIVEGEIDALTLAQESGDIVNVVATGTTTGSRVFKWESRLARQPFVFQSFDVDEDGEKHSGYWLNILSENSIRYRPLAHDVNDMHTSGYSVRSWVEGALLLLEDESEDTMPEQQDQDAPVSAQAAAQATTPVSPEQGQTDTLSEDQDAGNLLLCSVCGLSIEQDQDAQFYFDADGVLYCGSHGPHSAQTAAQSPREDQAAPDSGLEQFAQAVSAIVDALGPETRLERLEPGLTLREWLARQGRLPEQQDYTPVTLPALPRAQCLVKVLTTRRVKDGIEPRLIPCSGKPGQSGFCSEHESAALLLSLAHKLNYPQLYVEHVEMSRYQSREVVSLSEPSGFNGLIIPSGVASWEDYAVRSGSTIRRVLPRLKAMFDAQAAEKTGNKNRFELSEIFFGKFR